MRITYYIIVSLLVGQLSDAQTVSDFTRLVSSDLNGSARYTSMAGAFGALGGDLTAISFNPASRSLIFDDTCISHVFFFNFYYLIKFCILILTLKLI